MLIIAMCRHIVMLLDLFDSPRNDVGFGREPNQKGTLNSRKVLKGHAAAKATRPSIFVKIAQAMQDSKWIAYLAETPPATVLIGAASAQFRRSFGDD